MCWTSGASSCGLRERPVVDDRAVRALRRDAPDGLQMAGAASGGRPRRLGGPSRAPASRARTGRATREALIVEARQEVRLGRQEAAADCSALGIRRSVAGTQYRQRRARAPPPAPKESAPSARRTHPGAAPGADRPPESGVAGRLQRAVQDGRWSVLLSADRDRSFQPRPVGCRGLPSVKTAHATRVSGALPRGRPARGHPHRQWRPVRVDRHPWPVTLECLVDAARHRPSAHHARQSPRERPARTDASRAETGNHSSGRAQPARAATSLRARSDGATTTSARTRRSAIARPPRSGRPRPAPIPSASRRRSIPRTWKSVASVARGRSGSTPATLLEPGPSRRRHWPRRGRRWHLEHRVLQYVARKDRRTHACKSRDLNNIE